MKNKAKTFVIATASLMLLSVMQVSAASTELTENNMDTITAGAKAAAHARGTQSVSVVTMAQANERFNLGVAIASALGSNAVTEVATSATGNIIRSQGRSINGRYHSVKYNFSYNRR